MNEDEPVRMSLSEHFEELRVRLLWALAGLAVGVVICWFFREQIMKVVVHPLRMAQYEKKLLNLSPMESIIQYLKVSIVFGLLVTSPWVAYHMWRFIGAGLYPEERRVSYLYAGGSALLFAAGAAFSYGLMLPLVMEVLMAFDTANVSKDSLQFAEYVDFFFKTTMAMGLSFQVPVLMRFLSAVNLVERSTWRTNRKYAIVGAFLIAALITPPDPVSQISAGLPMVLLYEIGLLLIPRDTEHSDDPDEDE